MDEWRGTNRRTILIGALIVALALTATSWVAAGGGASSAYGEYVHLGITYDLDDDHVDIRSDAIVVDAPTGASEIRVKASFLDDQLHRWGADRAYDAADGRAVVADEEATFSTFEADASPAFTIGSADSVRFLERPMWVSVDATADGVKITAEDGTSEGQPIRVDKAWLAGYGVDQPVAVHEDGSVMDVRETVDGTAFVVEVAHFSSVDIINAKINDDWIDEDAENTFYHTDPDDVLAYNVTVEDSSAGNVTFLSTWTVNDTIEDYGRETYNQSTRESVERPGYYSYNWINETNLVEGEARIFRDTFDLVEVTDLSYVFENGSRRLYYDDDEGFLRKFNNTATEGAAKLISRDSRSLDAVRTAPSILENYTFDQLNGTKVKEDLESGSINLTFFGTTYNLEVQKVPWDSSPKVTHHRNGTEYSHELNSVAYNGTGSLSDGTPFKGLVKVTSAGVGGMIIEPNKTIAFDPLTFFDSGANGNLTVAYRSEDVNISGSPNSTVLPGGPDGSSASADSSSSGPDRDMVLWGDSEMYLEDNPEEKLSDAFDTVNFYFHQSTVIGFEFYNGSINICDDAQCDQNHNLTGTTKDTLLWEWANYMYWEWRDGDNGHHTHDHDYEFAALFTGVNTIGGGAAWQPGHYGIVDGKSSLRSRILAQEAGHGFNGAHGRREDPSDENDCDPDDKTKEGKWGRARCIWHDHPDEFHCHFPPHPIWQTIYDNANSDTCTEPHQHTVPYKHYTIMWGELETCSKCEFPWVFSDDNDQPDGEDKNYEWVRDCNTNEWDSISLEPSFNSGDGPCFS